MKTVIHSTAAVSSAAPLPHSPRILSKAGSTVPVQPANGSSQLSITRRASIAAFLLPSLTLTSACPAHAFSLGISGPKEWLREQKKKTSRYILAPIEASHRTLQKAYQLSKSAGPAEVEEIRGLINSASRDCVLNQRNSVVAFQSQTGVEVCTFSLVLKNASSLLDEKDPVKIEAEASLIQLIGSLSDIGSLVETSNFELSADRKRVEDGLMETISVLDKFELGVKSCLGI